MSRPKNTDTADTIERLLAAAEQEFGEVGFARARLSDIAARAGIRRPSLLYHFETKAALYAAVVQTINADVRKALAEAMATPAGLDTLFDGLIAFGAARRPALAMFVRELLDPAPEGVDHVHELAPIIDDIVAMVRARVGDVLPPDAPLRSAVLVMFTSQVLRIAAGPRADALWGKDDPRDLLRALTPFSQGDAP